MARDYNRGLSFRPRLLSMPEALIESLDHEGRGVAHVNDKVVFIESALPGEHVEYESYHRKARYEQAHATKVLLGSSQRVAPQCRHFGTCGGCSMQHLGVSAQVAAKQRILEDALWHIGRLKPDEFYQPINGPAWGYRYRARFSARYVVKKGGVLVGFHEKRRSYVADMDSCEVVPPHVSALLRPLGAMIMGLSEPDRFPQIELAIGDGQTVLVLRNLVPVTADDEQRLRDFADQHKIVWYLQPKGPATVQLFYPLDAPPLTYSLPEFGLAMGFSPTEFTQVNHGVNRVLVRRAMNLLDPKAGERIADMFCGLGNFTLPIAKLGANVVGIEGSRELVERARANAQFNGLAALTDFAVANLFEVTAESFGELGRFDKMLIDPPRDGAVALINALTDEAPRRIVYVSCKPSTLARDAAILTHDKGYRLSGAGIANMFPHTSHVESIALFERT